MESIVISNGKTDYIFSSDKIVEVTKKAIREINHDEIYEISYNPKFGIKDFFILISHVIFRIPLWQSYMNKAFVIFLKTYGNPVSIGVSNEDFEKIKSFFKIPIKLV